MPETLFFFIKNEFRAQVFSCEFCEISKNTFFTEHLRWLLLNNKRKEAIYSCDCSSSNANKQKQQITSSSLLMTVTASDWCVEKVANFRCRSRQPNCIWPIFIHFHIVITLDNVINKIYPANVNNTNNFRVDKFCIMIKFLQTSKSQHFVNIPQKQPVSGKFRETCRKTHTS